MTYEPIAEASTPDTCSAAAFTGSAARCAYLAVVPTCVWPSNLPISGSPWPAATAVAEAKVWRRSWMQASLESGTSAEALPPTLQVGKARTRQLAGDDPGLPSREDAAQDIRRWLADVNDLGSGLGVRQA